MGGEPDLKRKMKEVTNLFLFKFLKKKTIVRCEFCKVALAT